MDRARKDLLGSIVDGTFFIPAFYGTGAPQEEISFIEHRQPRFPFPDLTQPRWSEGNAIVDHLLATRGPTGEPIYFPDGFSISLMYTPIGQVDILVDTEYDRPLAGMIVKAQQELTTHPQWSTQRKVFEIAALCFGSWGQPRYPLASYQNVDPKDPPPQMLLSEYVWGTILEDLECVPYSVAMQIVGQACGLDISWHSGRAARFSPYCHGEGEHGWNIVQADHGPIVVDWANYPKTIEELFARAGRANRDQLYQQFVRAFGLFPAWIQEKYPPTMDMYYQIQSDDHPEYALRNTVAYWNDAWEYLGSCAVPAGFDTMHLC